jgi:hypothetical protein
VVSVRRVTVRNASPKPIRFDYISGSSLHFHASFFTKKTLEPGAETTFEVAFLPRHEGVINTELIINSSVGHHVFPVRACAHCATCMPDVQVTGRGVASPYEIRSSVSDVQSLALNGSMLVPIRLHNPHSRTMRILEMFTSSGDLHLEVGTDESRGRLNAETALWVCE